MTVAALYAAHFPYVRGVVRSLGIDEADVDDVAQEVFCVLLRRSAPQGEERGVRRWLYQTTRRVASNHRRGRRRYAQRLANAWAPPAPACPEAVAMGRDARQRLQREVDALPESARVLYRLSEVEGRPGPEVARVLGLNSNTAYARVRALRRHLARVLLLLALLLAALLVSQAGCVVTEVPSSAISRAPSTSSSAGVLYDVEGGPSASREVSDDRRRAALRGPALGLLVRAWAR